MKSHLPRFLVGAPLLAALAALAAGCGSSSETATEHRL